MNLVNLMQIIYSISICWSLELNKRTTESDGSILFRQKRGNPPISNNQSKSNNDNIKLQLGLKNVFPQISQRRPSIPLTNLRLKPRPVLANNRLDAINRVACEPKLNSPVKSIPSPPPAPPKNNEEEQPVISATTNTTKSDLEPKKAEFYVETDNKDEIDKKSDIVAPKLPLESHLKQTVLNELKKESSDEKKDKNDIIIGIMQKIPDMIKTAMAENMKSKENSIIIKNVTEINLPVISSNIKTENKISNDNEKENKTNSLLSDTVDELNTKTNDYYSQELMNLLLKPILQAKQNNAELLPSHDSLADNVENDVESIVIKQNNYSEIVEVNHKPIINKSKEIEQPVEEKLPVYTSPIHRSTNGVPNYNGNVYNPETAYTIPRVQATTPATNQYFYNTASMYTTPAGVYPNLYTPNMMYTKYPCEYSQNPQMSNINHALNKPKYNLATDNGSKAIDNFDYDKNIWRTWSNTEVVIRTNNNNTSMQNPESTLMQNGYYPRNYNLYNNYYYQNHYMPMYRNHPCYGVPRLRVAC